MKKTKNSKKVASSKKAHETFSDRKRVIKEMKSAGKTIKQIESYLKKAGYLPLKPFESRKLKTRN